METHQQADELDIAKEKVSCCVCFVLFPICIYSCGTQEWALDSCTTIHSFCPISLDFNAYLSFCSLFLLLFQVAKLARAEQAVEKYQKKLEEMLELKKQNKDLCDKMDQYLDQIHSLESANKVWFAFAMKLFDWCSFLPCISVRKWFTRFAIFSAPSCAFVADSLLSQKCKVVFCLTLSVAIFSLSVQGMATLNKMVEQYKNKAVELETEKFEALSSVQTRDQQVKIYAELCCYYILCF